MTTTVTVGNLAAGCGACHGQNAEGTDSEKKSSRVMESAWKASVASGG